MRSAKAINQNVAVVLDLDDTLLLSRSRTRIIVGDFMAQENISSEFPQEIAAMKAAPLDKYCYRLIDTFSALHIKEKKFVDQALEFWWKNFFTNEYGRQDLATPGALAFVKELDACGAKIIYLTGRVQDQMLQGTIDSLTSLGFPVGADYPLVLKPNSQMSDSDFKRQAVADLVDQYNIAAFIENEPKNLCIMGELCPEAALIFIDSRRSNLEDEVLPSFAVIKDFL